MSNVAYIIIGDSGILDCQLNKGKPYFNVTTHPWITADKNVANVLYRKLLNDGYIQPDARGVCELDNSDGHWNTLLELCKNAKV